MFCAFHGDLRFGIDFSNKSLPEFEYQMKSNKNNFKHHSTQLFQENPTDLKGEEGSMFEY